ncbi:MAG: hypothetical protein DRQ88_09260 [Epsilonproteobacteria bacterium]|nr:MAG: hypothetical protein DRQ88_09260 [Campylobacterota bacterium]
MKVDEFTPNQIEEFANIVVGKLTLSEAYQIMIDDAIYSLSEMPITEIIDLYREHGEPLPWENEDDS